MMVKKKKSQSKGKKGWFTRLLLLLNWLAIIGLLLAYLGAWTPPDSVWILAFFALAYPVWVLINLVFILIWILALKRYILYSSLAILLGFNYLSSYFQLSPSKLQSGGKPQYKVLSYNVKMLGSYEPVDQARETQKGILDFLTDEKPDILCLQEFYSDSTRRQLPVDSFRKHLAMRYKAIIPYQENNHSSFLAIFSQFPILTNGKVTDEKQKKCFAMYSDILMGKDTIRVYSVHLESIRLSKEDESFTAENLGLGKNKPGSDESQRLIKKLKRAFVKRASQARLLAEHIGKSPYPVMVCGDFNDTPASYAFHKVSKGLKDAFRVSGAGTGQSYAGKFPSFRIDYILHSKSIVSGNFTTGDQVFSDHYPIWCLFQIQ